MSRYDTSLRDIRLTLQKRKAVLLLFPLILGIASALLAILSAPAPLYTSVCRIKFDREVLSEGTPPAFPADPIDNQIAVIRSYPVLKEAVERLGGTLVPDASDLRPSGTTPPHFFDDLRSRVLVRREVASPMAEIVVTDGDPGFSQRLADTVAAVFREHYARDQEKRLAVSLDRIEVQLTDVQQALGEAQKAFESFSRLNQLLDLEVQGEALLKEGQDVQRQLRVLRTDARELKAILERLERFIENPTEMDRQFFSARASAQYQSLSESLQKPPLRGAPERDPRATEIAREMAGLLSLQIRNMGERIGLLEEAARDNAGKAGALLVDKLEFERLRKQIETYEGTVTLLEHKKREILIKGPGSLDALTVIGPASLPTERINPPGILPAALLGGLGGLFLGLVTVLVLEIFERSSGSVEDLEKTLGLHVLGIVPGTSFQGGEVEGGLGSLLASHYFPGSVVAENFRALRTRILSNMEGKGPRAVLVTSSSPREGKTLIALNLAVIAAQAGMKTLFVEADLRKPRLAEALGVAQAPGLTDVLVGDMPWPDALKTVTDLMMGKMTPDDIMRTPGLDNLHIITSGSVSANPALLLESKGLGHVIEEVQEAYDFVILDSPPVLAWNDATILGTRIPGALVVYRVGEVPKRSVKRALTQLGQVGCRPLGLVLNGTRPAINPDIGDEACGRRAALPGSERSSGRKPGDLFNLRSLSLLTALFLLLAVMWVWRSAVMDPFRGSESEPPAEVSKMQQTPPTGQAKERILEPVKAVTETIPVVKEKTAVDGPDRKPVEIEVPLDPFVPLRADKIEAAADPAVEEKAVLYPYSLYLGSFRTKGRADRAVSLYADKGVAAYWVRVRFEEKGLWYRVYAGHFEEASEAEQFIMKHGLQEAEVKHTQFANLVGIFSDPTGIQEQVNKLKGLDYSPYVIPGPDGSVNLYVGAYITLGGAENQNIRLKRDGIESRVVMR